jgi:hypothetical protein
VYLQVPSSVWVDALLSKFLPPKFITEVDVSSGAEPADGAAASELLATRDSNSRNAWGGGMVATLRSDPEMAPPPRSLDRNTECPGRIMDLFVVNNTNIR